MPKAEWGVKRTCLGCGARFYDLTRTPVVCPKCDEELDIAVQQKPKRTKPAARKPAAKVVATNTDDLVDDADAADDVEVDAGSVSDDAVLETDDDDSDVIVAKGGKDDDDSESIEKNVLLDDAGDDDTDEDDAVDDDADKDEDPGDAKTAKTGGGKAKGS